MSDDLSDIEYVIAALAQARNDGVTISELVWLALDADTPEHFDYLVNVYTQYTRPPEPDTQLPDWWSELTADM